MSLVSAKVATVGSKRGHQTMCFSQRWDWVLVTFLLVYVIIFSTFMVGAVLF